MLVNGQKVLELEQKGLLDLDELYVYADIVRPGSHVYSVKKHEEQRFMHRTIVRNREE